MQLLPYFTPSQLPTFRGLRPFLLEEPLEFSSIGNLFTTTFRRRHSFGCCEAALTSLFAGPMNNFGTDISRPATAGQIKSFLNYKSLEKTDEVSQLRWFLLEAVRPLPDK